MENFKISVSKDTAQITVFKPSSNYVFHGLYGGHVGLQSERVESPLEYGNECRVFHKDNPSLTYFHTYYNRGWAKKRNGKVVKTYDENFSAIFAGLSSCHRHIDQPRNEVLDYYIDHLKLKGADFRFKMFHVAFDIELDTNIDHFFPLKLAKTNRINSSFFYFVGDDGSRTYYLEMKTKSGKTCTTRFYFYEKDKKEGLGGRRIFRCELVIDGLNPIGDDPDKIIKRIEKVIGRYRLFHFEDVSLCNEFKNQYDENIGKDQSPNVPKKLLEDIERYSTPIPLELTSEFKSWIFNALDRTTEAKPIKRKTFIDKAFERGKRTRISEKQKTRIRIKIRNRVRKNKLEIRKRTEELQQCVPVHIQLGALKNDGELTFYTPTFYVYTTGPPIGYDRILYLNLDKFYAGTAAPLAFGFGFIPTKVHEVPHGFWHRVDMTGFFVFWHLPNLGLFYVVDFRRRIG